MATVVAACLAVTLVPATALAAPPEPEPDDVVVAAAAGPVLDWFTRPDGQFVMTLVSPWTDRMMTFYPRSIHPDTNTQPRTLDSVMRQFTQLRSQVRTMTGWDIEDPAQRAVLKQRMQRFADHLDGVRCHGGQCYPRWDALYDELHEPDCRGRCLHGPNAVQVVGLGMIAAGVGFTFAGAGLPALATGGAVLAAALAVGVANYIWDSKRHLANTRLTERANRERQAGLNAVYSLLMNANGAAMAAIEQVRRENGELRDRLAAAEGQINRLAGHPGDVAGMVRR